jgi:hypothetical protein
MSQITEKQKKMFFALGHALKKDPETLKESAKKYFKVEHFNDLTVEQGTYLIDKLMKLQEVKYENK